MSGFVLHFGEFVMKHQFVLKHEMVAFEFQKDARRDAGFHVALAIAYVSDDEIGHIGVYLDSERRFHIHRRGMRGGGDGSSVGADGFGSGVGLRLTVPVL